MSKVYTVPLFIAVFGGKMSATLLYIKTTSQRKREKVSLAIHVTFAHELLEFRKKFTKSTLAR